MSEKYGRRAVELTLVTLAIAGCTAADNEAETASHSPQSTATVSRQIQSAAPEVSRKLAGDSGDFDLQRYVDEIKCIIRNYGWEDCDGDTVVNSWDIYEGRDDLADDDSDFVINALDKWAGLDDTKFDADQDGLPDYLDTFNGNNYLDFDGDGLANAIDLQPYSAPPQPVHITPPSSVTNKKLYDAVLNDQIKRKVGLQSMPNQQDTDLDGIPDAQDPEPDEFTNDRDGDGTADYYDPRPSDYTVTPQNDPYNPLNNEYWNKDKFGYNDPYDGKD